MTQEQESHLPFLPSVENLALLSSFISGQSSRPSCSEELNQPLRSHDGIACFSNPYDDLELHLEEHDEQQQSKPQSKPPIAAPVSVDYTNDMAVMDGGESETSNSELSACLSCQKRKSKCDRGQPCSTCQFLRLECTYKKPLKRGPKPGSMLRIKEESRHLKLAARDLIQALADVNADFGELRMLSQELLDDSRVFDAACCQSMLRILKGCLSRSRQPKRNTQLKGSSGNAKQQQ